MSASMAEGMAATLAEHGEVRIFGTRCRCGKALYAKDVTGSLTAHQAEVLAANGYGKLEDATHELKFLRGERKTLGKELDFFERQGHTTVTIKYLRRFLGRRPE